jgi:hypothetical protein
MEKDMRAVYFKHMSRYWREGIWISSETSSTDLQNSKREYHIIQTPAHAGRSYSASTLLILCMNHNVTNLLKALLSNGSVNTFQHMRHWTIRWKCFLRGPRHATIWAVYFLHDPCRVYIARIVGGTRWVAGNRLVECRLVQMGTRSRSTRQGIELENCIEFWRIGIARRLKKKWQEDFIAIWSDSFCIEIRCQETTNWDWES